MRRQLIYLLAIATPVLAGTIDSGRIISHVSDGWDVDISSTSGNYSVTFSPAAGNLVSCVFCPKIRAGDLVSFSGNTSASYSGSGGQATIGGIFYPALIFDAQGLGISSVIDLDISFIAGEPGSYVIPFAMTGVLQAAPVGDPGNFVLNDPVSGYGYATLTLFGTPESETLAPTIVWTFVPVPEPITMGLVGFGLALILGARVRRSRY